MLLGREVKKLNINALSSHNAHFSCTSVHARVSFFLYARACACKQRVWLGMNACLITMKICTKTVILMSQYLLSMVSHLPDRDAGRVPSKFESFVHLVMSHPASFRSHWDVSGSQPGPSQWWAKQSKTSKRKKKGGGSRKGNDEIEVMEGFVFLWAESNVGR